MSKLSQFPQNFPWTVCKVKDRDVMAGHVGKGKLGRINIGELDTHTAPGSEEGKGAAALQYQPK